MVGIAFQDDVKKAFSKVKDDLLNLKRSVNRELLAVEEIGGRLQTFVAKEDFYSFIKRLGERLEKIESNLYVYSGYENEIKEAETKINNLSKKFSRQENLHAEIKEVRKLRGKLEELGGSTVNVQDFNKEINKLLESLSSVKKSMLTGKVFENAKSEMANANKRLENLEKSVPSKESVSNNLEAIKSLRQNSEKLESDGQKKLDSVERSLRKEIETVKELSVEKESFDKKSGEMTKELNSLKNLLDSSVSEIDLSDYVTKKDLGKKLLKVDEVKVEIEKLANSLSKAEGNLRSVKKNSASLDDIDRIGSDVRGISKSIDALKAGIEKVSEVVQNRLDKRLEQTDEKFERELAKLKSEFEGKVSKERKEGKSVLSKLKMGITDFFKEEDAPPKKEEKEKKFDISEFVKDGEKKPGKGSFLVIGGVIAVIVIASLFFYFSADRGIVEEELVEDIEEIEKEVSIEEEAVEEETVAIEEQAEEVVIEEVVEEEAEVIPKEEVIIEEATEEMPVIEEEVVEEVTDESVEEVIEEVPEEVVEEQVEEITKEAAEEEAEEAALIEEFIEEDVAEELPEEVTEEVPEELPEDEVVAVEEPTEEELIEEEVISAEESCKEKYECKEGLPGEYWFNCHLDEEGVCRCFVTDAEGCGIVEEVSEVEEESEDLRSNAIYLVIAAFVLAVMVGFYIVSSKNGKKGSDKKKEKDEEGVDLEEFFQKK